MSTKDWKNRELTTILSEAFGFKFNLDKLNEGADKNTGMSGVKGDDDDDTYMGHVKEEEELEEDLRRRSGGAEGKEAEEESSASGGAEKGVSPGSKQGLGRVVTMSG